jgi:PilZ domain
LFGSGLGRAISVQLERQRCGIVILHGRGRAREAPAFSFPSRRRQQSCFPSARSPRYMAKSQASAGLIPRATRFRIEVPLRYRSVGERTWHDGQIENISGSGVLFRAGPLFAVATVIEFAFSVPFTSSGNSHAEVFCRAQVVRAAPPTPADTRPGLAAAIRGYRLTTKPGRRSHARGSRNA